MAGQREPGHGAARRGPGARPRDPGQEEGPEPGRAARGGRRRRQIQEICECPSHPVPSARPGSRPPDPGGPRGHLRRPRGCTPVFREPPPRLPFSFYTGLWGSPARPPARPGPRGAPRLPSPRPPRLLPGHLGPSSPPAPTPLCPAPPKPRQSSPVSFLAPHFLSSSSVTPNTHTHTFSALVPQCFSEPVSPGSPSPVLLAFCLLLLKATSFPRSSAFTC